MQELGDQLAAPGSCIIPVRNYSHELELDSHWDILALGAVAQTLRFIDRLDI